MSYWNWEHDVATAKRCVTLFYWSRSECQWAVHHISVTGEFEWYFW